MKFKLYFALPFIMILVVAAYFRYYNNSLSYSNYGSAAVDQNGPYTDVRLTHSSFSVTLGQDVTKTSFRDGRRGHFPSKEVIIRSVYFDSRQRKDHHNTSVFLVLVWKNITDNRLLSGCQIGDKRSENWDFALIGETRLWRVYPQYNVIDHEEVIINCYDLPGRNGSEAYIFYKTSLNSTNEKMVRSERPLMFPAPRRTPTSSMGLKYNLTILTCTKVFGNPPWLIEWLTYQRAIGVDHVHLIAEESFFRSIGKKLSLMLEDLIVEGFLSVDFWIMWLSGREVWYHNQGLILEDCLYQFRGTYDYLFILDTDDFFTPRVPGEDKAHYYINRLCVRKDTGSCMFRWVEFYPDYYGFNQSIPLVNGNVTNLLRSYDHYNQGNRKSVHRTDALIDVATHFAFHLVDGYSKVEFPVDLAYVAHVRKSKRPTLKDIIVGLP